MGKERDPRKNRVRNQNPFSSFWSLFSFRICPLLLFSFQRCLKEPLKSFLLVPRVLKTPNFSIRWILMSPSFAALRSRKAVLHQEKVWSQSGTRILFSPYPMVFQNSH